MLRHVSHREDVIFLSLYWFQMVSHTSWRINEYPETMSPTVFALKLRGRRYWKISICFGIRVDLLSKILENMFVAQIFSTQSFNLLIITERSIFLRYGYNLLVNRSIGCSNTFPKHQSLVSLFQIPFKMINRFRCSLKSRRNKTWRLHHFVIDNPEEQHSYSIVYSL